MAYHVLKEDEHRLELWKVAFGANNQGHRLGHPDMPDRPADTENRLLGSRWRFCYVRLV